MEDPGDRAEAEAELVAAAAMATVVEARLEATLLLEHPQAMREVVLERLLTQQEVVVEMQRPQRQVLEVEEALMTETLAEQME